MGFIGKAVKKVVGGIGKVLGFGGSSQKENPVVIPQPTVTAQQLVPQTEAVVPEAPELGTDVKKRKKVSRKSLMIDRSTPTGGGGSPLNM